MVKLLSLAAAATLLTATSAVDVACVVNGVSVATVDLETGTCPFPIPADLPVTFDFSSADDFKVDFYYALANNNRFYNDIVAAGRIIEIAAIDLYQQAAAQLFGVHLEQRPSGNSTAAIRKRLLGKSKLASRDEISDFVDHLKTLDGAAIPGTPIEFAVVDPVNATSSSSVPAVTSTASRSATGSASGSATITGSASGTLTVTDKHTTVVTITSCSDNKCHETTVAATPAVTTQTVDGKTTVYTTYCPVETTKAAEITSTYTSAGTVYTTVCPATEVVSTYTSNGKPYTTTYLTAVTPVTKTQEVVSVWTSAGKPYTTTYYTTATEVPVTSVWTSAGKPYTTVYYGTVSDVAQQTQKTVVAAPSAAAPSPVISVYSTNAAAAAAGSFLMFAMVPLAYLI
ncbi:uncharacterized protein CANTADRAFT_143310 [Suhomyces tanzawaensis NRRL Y-17324]|uniref:Uncharacterized protein n=1 Tax=Suhomyces tanzawaensis NRRL Y-17324 TaxID=984487 RepID=A0A1E4SS96_9ASCO|nr:uncharacterized protein CANTADRAFT_143310 [Suhomyces tanzawaensis NRRL Y-17324]ODV82371.1 hypothetical protein CANTADRAFT_143310 [Suhomyces tanzawaensis NRRL Y-17324]